MSNGKVVYENKEMFFDNLYQLVIDVNGKAWCYDDKRSNAKQLSFKTVELGYAGLGNWLRQWRARGRLKRVKATTKEAGTKQRPQFHPLTQADAATILKVSQSFIAKVENQRKPMPLWMFRKIQKDVLKYGRTTIPPEA